MQVVDSEEDRSDRKDQEVIVRAACFLPLKSAQRRLLHFAVTVLAVIAVINLCFVHPQKAYERNIFPPVSRNP